ncbi:MAG: DNA polymerase III subunit beta [Candidatus Omnitrophota bacterium]|nr:DNA polymerase III subunit beta [Candidatus Omnitrophota bacterium]
MRLTIPQPQLLKNLQIIERVINERSTLPILANVLVRAEENELVLTATDLDVGIQCRFPLAQPVEKGAVTLPARRFTTIIRELPEEAVTLEAKKNQTASLTCAGSSFRIPGLPAEDFPAFPATAQGEGIRLPGAVLRELIAKTAYAMSMEEARFVLNGALLTTQKDQITVVATDGRRLALASAPMGGQGRQSLHVVIPSKTIRELGRLLQSDDLDEVALAPLKDNQLTMRFGAVTMITRLIDGQFPQYEKVIPAPAKHAVTCRRGLLIDALRRVSLMTTATSQAVVFELEPERLVVSKESPEVGSAREELPATYRGERTTIAFNPGFWLDVLKVLEGEEVEIEVAGPDRPAVIRQPNFTYLVLPMKLA